MELISNMREFYHTSLIDFMYRFYNWTAHEILTNEIYLILPKFPKDRKEKRGIISSLVTSFIGLTYEGISDYLHNKRQKVLHKTFEAMENKVNLEQNRIFHIEDLMVKYGIYNLDTLEKLIDTVHKIHSKTTWNKKLFASKLNVWYHWYLSKDGVGHYAKNISFDFNNDNRKTCQNVWDIYQSIEIVWQSNTSSFKGLFANFSIATIKIT